MFELVFLNALVSESVWEKNIMSLPVSQAIREDAAPRAFVVLPNVS